MYLKGALVTAARAPCLLRSAEDMQRGNQGSAPVLREGLGPERRATAPSREGATSPLTPSPSPSTTPAQPRARIARTYALEAVRSKGRAHAVDYLRSELTVHCIPRESSTQKTTHAVQ